MAMFEQHAKVRLTHINELLIIKVRKLEGVGSFLFPISHFSSRRGAFYLSTIAFKGTLASAYLPTTLPRVRQTRHGYQSYALGNTVVL
jgi:hypothetical protein